MTDARDEILTRVRTALAPGASKVAPAADGDAGGGAPREGGGAAAHAARIAPRGYRTGRTLSAEERLALFSERVRDYRAELRTCAAARTAEAVAEVLRGHGARRVGVPAGLDAGWLAGFLDEGAEVVTDGVEVPVAVLDTLDAVVTASAAACAETGTVFLDGSSDQGRRALTLVPDLHVCVVDLSAVEPGVPEALARLVPTRPITMISGPSATSDIELERVEGVHGPRTLVVVVRTDL
ncbi:lactate utilization protein C [Streptomyces sp. NPDC060194]|uniref:LutC/YkgG family protein n=1 Tax=Streptomyces sp. NPDC060194 TaxID=3347069 RepID=UPI00365F5A75